MLQDSTFTNPGIAVQPRPQPSQESPGIGQWRKLLAPMDFRTFLWWLVVLLVVAVGAGLVIMSSVRLAETQVRLAALQGAYAEQERINAELMWQISRHTNLEHIKQRADAMGFSINYTNLYVAVPAQEAAAGQGSALEAAAGSMALTSNRIQRTGLDAAQVSTRYSVTLPPNVDRWLEASGLNGLWANAGVHWDEWRNQTAELLAPVIDTLTERESVVQR